jgi:hypothetical protein
LFDTPFVIKAVAEDPSPQKKAVAEDPCVVLDRLNECAENLQAGKVCKEDEGEEASLTCSLRSCRLFDTSSADRQTDYVFAGWEGLRIPPIQRRFFLSLENTLWEVY